MYEFSVESAHVLQFGRAVGDPNGAPDVAPPTFLMAADHFDPAYERRPQPGVPWITDLPASPDQQAGFHVEQHFEFQRPVRVGDRLVVTSAPGATWSRSGKRAGTLDFSEILTEYRDLDGSLVASARWVQAAVGRRPEGNSALGAVEKQVESVATETGQGWQAVVLERLNRSQIGMYAGASGDFHPLHVDEPYAQKRGWPGVFAHGMLTMGMTGSAVTATFGRAAIRAFGGRIQGQVWPGDTLVADIRKIADCEYAVCTRNQHDAVVFSGRARTFAETLDKS